MEDDEFKYNEDQGEEGLRKNERKSRTGVGAGSIVLGLLGGIAGGLTQVEGGFVFVLILIGGAVLVFIAMMVYLIYLKTVGQKIDKRKLAKANKENIKRMLERYDYTSSIDEPQNGFFAENIGIVNFIEGGINIQTYDADDTDHFYRYVESKNNIVFDMLNIPKAQLDVDDNLDSYIIPLFVPYSEIDFSAEYFNSSEIPSNFLYLSFLYKGRELRGNIELTKYVLDCLRRFNLSVNGLDEAIAPHEKFVDTDTEKFVVNTRTVGISSLGISLTSHLQTITILYSQIKKITICKDTMLVNAGHKYFFIPFKEKIYTALRANFFGEIISEDSLDDYCEICLFEPLPIISKLAVEKILGDGRFYVEIFKIPDQDQYFYLTTVYDQYGYCWKLQDSRDNLIFFKTLEVTLEAARQTLQELNLDKNLN